MRYSSERVLVLAASQRDADSTREILEHEKIECLSCQTLEDLTDRIREGAGALILAKEVLTAENIVILAELLENQPTWSFLPIILIISAGDLGNEQALRSLKPLRNSTFLERPVRVGALISIVHAALNDRRRQYKLRRLLQDLEKSKEQAEEASRAKTTFLANMSHEIRTPLGAILGFSELLTEPGTDEEEKKVFAKTVKRNGQLLLALIDDILDLAKVESGHISVEDIEVSFPEMVSEVISALKPRASAKNIPLVTAGVSRIPVKIKTDPIRLKQILINVIGNAVKFTSLGKVAVHFAWEPVLTSKGRGVLRVEVTDTGIGISPEQAQRLFQPFSQADNSITRKFGGTGLGLVLSRRLAQLMGGDLRLTQSQPGQGSTFEITVGCGVLEPAPMMKTVESHQHILPEFSYSRQLLGKNILLVDDAEDNQALIGRMLALSGANVTVASDGQEAIERALAGNFDAVLMDVQMPRMDGHEAARRLRRKGYSRPMIALTAHALREDRDLCLKAGFNDYLSKPVNRKDLIQMTAQYCFEGEQAVIH